MATTRKRQRTSKPPKSKVSKRQVTVETFRKWQRSFEKDYASLEWLRCNEDDEEKSLVSVLWCVVCCKYELKIVGHKNFSRAWSDGSTNHRSCSQ